MQRWKGMLGLAVALFALLSTLMFDTIHIVHADEPIPTPTPTTAPDGGGGGDHTGE